jgi:hypothetical protein
MGYFCCFGILLCLLGLSCADWADRSKQATFTSDVSIDEQLSLVWRRFVDDLGAERTFFFRTQSITSLEYRRKFYTSNLFHTF